ncbi:MAG: HU family DNA-binding protein [Planctomycetota bacterium]|nr:MAG: HU family DNA-binding protein [Planctomycetota bacterium]
MSAHGNVSATVSKRQLAETIAQRSGLPHAQILNILQHVLDGISDELAKGNRLEFRDFGVFELAQRKSRKAMNPRTLEPVTIEKRTVVKFKPGRVMKERVVHLDLDGSAGASSPE